MIFIIPGNPIANARPRLGKWGIYDSQKKLKNDVRKIISNQLRELKILNEMESFNNDIFHANNDHFDIKMIFCMPIAKNTPESKKNMLSWNCIENESNKDNDNMEKFYLDCANGILFSDDRYVTNLQSKRISSVNPKVIIMIKKRKNLSDEVCGILGIFSRSEMSDLLQDLEDIYMLYDVDPKEDWVLDAVGEDDVREVRLSKTAFLLSRLAEYSDKLKQIKRKFGGFHQRCQKAFATEVESV